jgi:hypothetical protein
MYIRSSPPPFLLGIIVAKDHVMVNLVGVISLLLSYWPPPVRMDAVLVTIVAGGQARFQYNKRLMEINKFLH